MALVPTNPSICGNSIRKFMLGRFSTRPNVLYAAERLVCYFVDQSPDLYEKSTYRYGLGC